MHPFAGRSVLLWWWLVWLLVWLLMSSSWLACLALRLVWLLVLVWPDVGVVGVVAGAMVHVQAAYSSCGRWRANERSRVLLTRRVVMVFSLCV